MGTELCKHTKIVKLNYVQEISIGNGSEEQVSYSGCSTSHQNLRYLLNRTRTPRRGIWVVTKVPCCRSYEELIQEVVRLPVEAGKFFFPKESKPIVQPTKPSTECETKGSFPGVLLHMLAWRAQGKFYDYKKYCISLGATAPQRERGLLIQEVSRSHTTKQYSWQESSGRVISSSDRPLPDKTQHSQQTNIHAPGGIRTQNLSRRAVADLRLRPRSHWDQRCDKMPKVIHCKMQFSHKILNTKFLISPCEVRNFFLCTFT